MASLQQFVDNLTKLNLHANAVIQDVRNFDGTKQDFNELTTDARCALQELRLNIENTEEVAGLQDKETDKVSFQHAAKLQRDQLNSLYTALRKACLVGQTAVEKKEKELLLSGDGQDLRNRKIKDKASVARASSRVTESLTSVSQMMAQQLQYSEKTLDVLATSSKNVLSTQEELKNMQGHIKGAKTLLTKYDRRELTDKCLIILALVFFFATVFYILKKRIWSYSTGGDSSELSAQV